MDRTKTLEQLENDVWTEVESKIPLVRRIFEYRKIPLNKLSFEQIRLLISQQFGLKFLVPMALEVLDFNIWAEGDYYEGDVLSAVLNVEKSFWKENKALYAQAKTLVQNNLSEVERGNTEDAHKQLLQAMKDFLA